MNVGDTFSIMSETPCESSDPSVVEIRYDGGKEYTAIAVGPGTATITGATWMESSKEYIFTVKDPAADTQPAVNAHQMLNETDNGGLFKKVFTVSPGFTLIFAAVSLFIACMFVLVFASIGKARKLDTAMANIQANPCQETAEAAVKEFTKINKFVKMNLSMGGDNRGTHFTMWRETFNRVVIPCNKITPETKRALRLALISMTTHGLLDVQTPEAAKEAAQAFGTGGEDNVWHNLKALHAMGKYDVYRDVNLKTVAGNSQVDAIVVAENGGVFLLEVKSAGGKRNFNGVKMVSYQDLAEDPGNQILRHKAAFLGIMSDCGISDEQIRNVLVLSYPHGEERRMVDYSSFPSSCYQPVSVDGLLEFITGKNQPVLTMETRKAISAKLMFCAKESLVNCLTSKNLDEIMAAGRKTSVCTECGNKLRMDEAFCPKCGKKR
jgi:hypothetical protein